MERESFIPEEIQDSSEEKMDNQDENRGDRITALDEWLESSLSEIVDDETERAAVIQKIAKVAKDRSVPKEYLDEWGKQNPQHAELDHVLRYRHLDRDEEVETIVRKYLAKYDEITESGMEDIAKKADAV